MTAQTDEWLTIAEACRRLKVTRATLYRWARGGKLRMYRMGERSTRVRLSDIDALLRQNPGAPHVTIVGSSRFKVLDLGPSLATVQDAIDEFTPDHGGHDVYVNQEPCRNLLRALEPGDLIVLMTPEEIEASRRESWSDEERRAWLHLAESSFNKDWDNEADAIYDNWKELYGVSDR